jgi:adenine/guanine phosphoribosyltransferase-like PRPP-binding protein
MDLPQLETKVNGDIAEVSTEAVAVESWIKANWQYAVAIAVGALILGVAFGYRLGVHAHA